jgi:Flp pilus assembly protein TadD
MRQGGILLITAAVLTCTACLGDAGKLEIRSTSNGLKAGRAPVPFRIAEARAHLALGNVALALEGFRKAARDDPNSVEAQAGIASCYGQMGRYDLARRHYEMALALAPADAGLLAAFAGTLEAQGLTVEAAAVRRELVALAAPAALAPALAAAPPVEITAPAVEPARVAEAPSPAPAAAPAAPEIAAPVGHSVTIALPPPRPAASAPAPAAKGNAMAVAPVGRSVTIALAPPRAATSQPPRLERLSLTEVALVTASGPRWKRPDAPPVRTAIRSLPMRPTEVRVLNAARIDRLAARTRTFLGHFGWREIAVGDAAAVRARSLIVYPHGTQAAARRLSARLGFAMTERANVRQVTILLGRDAAAHPGLRPKA